MFEEDENDLCVEDFRENDDSDDDTYSDSIVDEANENEADDAEDDYAGTNSVSRTFAAMIFANISIVIFADFHFYVSEGRRRKLGSNLKIVLSFFFARVNYKNMFLLFTYFVLVPSIYLFYITRHSPWATIIK